MRLPLLTPLLTLPILPLTLAAPLTPRASSSSSLPAYFLLAGDSTTATQSDNGGGWGDGFLNTTLQGGAAGKNYGHNGATTVSFREDGDWDEVLGDVKDKKGAYEVWVTVQVCVFVFFFGGRGWFCGEGVFWGRGWDGWMRG